MKLDLYEAMVDRDTRWSIFDLTIRTKIGRSDTMGTHEYLLDKWEKRGIEKGLQKGRAEERANIEAEKLAEKQAIALEFKKMGISVKDIARHQAFRRRNRKIKITLR